MKQDGVARPDGVSAIIRVNAPSVAVTALSDDWLRLLSAEDAGQYAREHFKNQNQAIAIQMLMHRDRTLELRELVGLLGWKLELFEIDRQELAKLTKQQLDKLDKQGYKVDYQTNKRRRVDLQKRMSRVRRTLKEAKLLK